MLSQAHGLSSLAPGPWPALALWSLTGELLPTRLGLLPTCPTVPSGLDYVTSSEEPSLIHRHGNLLFILLCHLSIFPLQYGLPCVIVFSLTSLFIVSPTLLSSPEGRVSKLLCSHYEHSSWFTPDIFHLSVCLSSIVFQAYMYVICNI